MNNWLKHRLQSRPQFCLFCGNPPRAKTREHVIPKWLIELTGDLNREITVGPLVSQHVLSTASNIFRTFSFNSFTFPSCGECNSNFAKLESATKPLLTALIHGEALSAGDFDIVLDWFDKVRVGLWLGFHFFLDHNYWGIRPHFFIKDRIGTADRSLLIYQADHNQPGIRFVGVNTPAFAHAPSCFTLIINEWFLTNVSSQFLLAEGTGLPFAEDLEFAANESIVASVVSGKDVLSSPILRIDHSPDAVVLLQPILGEFARTKENADLYSSTYIDSLTLCSSHLRPLIQKQATAMVYPLSKSDYWQPAINIAYESLFHANVIETLSIQNRLIETIHVSQSLPEDQRNYFETEFTNCVKANRHILSLFSDS